MRWAAGIVLVAATALAEPPGRAPVYLELDPCLGADEGAVRRAAAIELGAPLLDGRRADAARILISCSDDGARLAVDDPLTHKRLERDLPLGGVEATLRVRLVAVAAAELLVASWIELESDRSPRASVHVATPASNDAIATVQALRERDAPVVSFAAVGIAHVFGSGVATFGGGVGTSVRLDSPLTLKVDVVLEHGERDVDFGSADALLASVAPCLEWPIAVGGLTIAPCAGARVGVAVLSGTPAGPSPLPLAGTNLSAAWGGPTLSAVVRGGSRSFLVSIGGEFGWTVAAVDATVLSHHFAVVDGPFVGFVAALAVAP